MPRFLCEYCGKLIHNKNPKTILTHNKGNKHQLMKKAFYLELEENHLVKAEIATARLLLDVDLSAPKIKQLRVFKKPDIPYSKGFSIPDGPPGFSLPADFDFYDIKNFPEDLEVAIALVENKRSSAGPLTNN